MNMMNDQFAKQAEQFLKVAGDARLPENMQAFAQESLAKSREAYVKIAAAAQEGAKVLEKVSVESQQGAKTIGETILKNVARNTEAAFDAAEAIVKARSLPEAAKIQADFMQASLAQMSEQTKEFFELSSKVAKQTFDSINGAAVHASEKTRKGR